MGYGVRIATRTPLTSPERVVVSIHGHGGFLMNGMEISTAWTTGSRAAEGPGARARRLRSAGARARRPARAEAA